MPKVIVIDPYAQTVTEREIDKPLDWRALKEIIGNWIEIAGRTRDGNMLIVDEEGRLKTSQSYFENFMFHPAVLAGVGVVVGSETGEFFTDHTSDLKKIEASTTFFGDKNA